MGDLEDVVLNWLKKKSASTDRQAGPERYQGRPLLMLLDSFVLSCIGQLPGDKEQKLHAVVQKIWPGPGDWKQRLRETLHLEPAIEQHIADLWARNTEIAKGSGETLLPLQFAIMVVDDNFASLIDQK